MNRYPLSPEERDMFLRLAAGDESAAEDIIRYNSANMAKVVAKHAPKGDCVCTRDDLMQAARITLWKNIPKFDISKGKSFFSFAYRDVETAVIDESVKHRFAVYIPADLQHEAPRADVTKLTARKTETIELARRSMQHSDDVDGLEIEDINRRFEHLIEEAIDDERVKALVEDTLTDRRERVAVKMKLGLMDGVEYTDQEIADAIGVKSRQHVNYILRNALQKLKRVFDGPWAA